MIGETITVAPAEEKVWKIEEIAHQVNRQKQFFVLAYMALFVSVFSFAFGRRQNKKRFQSILS